MKKIIYKCISERLMHTAARYRETPGPKLKKFGGISDHCVDWPDP